MRTIGFFALCAVLNAGCFGGYCDQFWLGQECPDATASGAGGTGGNGGENAGGNAGGEGGEGGGIIPVECLPAEGGAIADTCGAFVRFDTDGACTATDPCGTLESAIASLGANKQIYICGGDVFMGSVELPAGVSVYGSLSCGDWKYAQTNARPTLYGDQNIPAVSIQGGDATLQALQITSPNASGSNTTTLQGNSSIALLVANADITLE